MHQATYENKPRSTLTRNGISPRNKKHEFCIYILQFHIKFYLLERYQNEEGSERFKTLEWRQNSEIDWNYWRPKAKMKVCTEGWPEKNPGTWFQFQVPGNLLLKILSRGLREISTMLKVSQDEIALFTTLCQIPIIRHFNLLFVCVSVDLKFSRCCKTDSKSN